MTDASKALARTTDGPRGAGLTAPQKAALVIAALGPEGAGPIIERIGDKHLKAFAEAYAHLRTIPRQELVSVVGEFVSELGGSGGEAGMKSGFDGARELIEHFKGADDATKILDDINVPGGRTVWQKLESIADEAIAKYLSAQSPQTVAVIISRLNTDKASSLLACLEADLAQKVLIKLATPFAVRKEALRVLADAVERDFLGPIRAQSKAKRPGLAIGAMMNNMPAEKREAFLKFIEAEAPAIVDDVKSSILTFQDLPTRLPPNAVPAVVRELEVNQFLKAAKYARTNAPEALEFIFKNISQRMKQQYEEQMEGLKQVTLADAEAAQGAFMTAVRRLVAAGEIKLVEIAKETEEEVAYI